MALLSPPPIHLCRQYRQEHSTLFLFEFTILQGLFLKPIARLNISVQLPHLTEPGKTISNWEVMEKMKGMAKPDSFTMIKVAKSTMDFVRFEAEVEVTNSMY